MNDLTRDASPENSLPATDQIIQRLGGRHLILRRKWGSRPWFPTPSALISDFRGPVWAFYGLGQIWLTHQHYRSYDGWNSRVSRYRGVPLIETLDQMEAAINRFTHFCNEHGIEGTIVIEPHEIEFHWTFGYQLASERDKPQHADAMEREFSRLADACQAAQGHRRTVAGV